MKKLISVLLTFIMVFALAACSGGKEKEKPSESTNGEKVEQTTKSKDELEHVTIKFTYPGSTQKDEAMVEKAINEYLKDKINATIDLNPIDWAAYLESTGLMMATGEELDMVFTASWYDYYTNVSKQAYVPLDDLIDQYAPKTKELLNPALLAGPKVKGFVYGLPTNKEIATSDGLFFRKDLVEKYNFDITEFKSIEDFKNVIEPMLAVIKENEPGIYPMYNNGLNAFARPWLQTNIEIGDSETPGTYDLDTGEVVYAQETKEMMYLTTLANEWYSKGYINEDAITAEQWVPNMFCTWMPYKPGKDSEMSTQLGVELIGIQTNEPIVTTTSVTGSMIAISRTSKNPERSMMFLELLNTDKYLNNLLNYGIEGVHYVKVSDNVIDFPEGIDASSCTYYPAAQWMFQNQFLNYLRVGEAEDKWEKFEQYNDSARISPILGFAFDNSQVKNEIAACKNVYDEYERALRNGVLDPKVTVPEYIQKMKANGAQVISDEKKKQIEEFLKNKN